MQKTATLDRKRGTLLGLTIGDALGAPVEFHPPGSFERVTDFRGGGPHSLAAGEWTDDTSLALALADGIGGVGSITPQTHQNAESFRVFHARQEKYRPEFAWLGVVRK